MTERDQGYWEGHADQKEWMKEVVKELKVDNARLIKILRHIKWLVGSIKGRGAEMIFDACEDALSGVGVSDD